MGAIKIIFLCQYLTKEDYRVLTPLFYGHVNPYGILRLDMTERLPIRQEAAS
ncbi:hypothetical protein KTAU_31040 [Thermogemmatispora aurantia]|nr:hypothetical protein KTAU_31040 [Thermogemmatispora aurantia]